MTITRDTTAAVRRIQVEAFRRLDGPSRLRMALEMSEEALQVTRAGVRHRHPDWTDAAVHDELLRLTLGRKLATAVLERSRSAP